MRIVPIILLVMLMACNNAPRAQAEDTGNPAVGNQPVATDSTAGGETTGVDSSRLTTYFDANNAWGYLVAQCEMGFRVPGTKTHVACRRWLVDVLRRHCDEVELQEFTRKLPPDDQDITMWNIIGRFNPGAERRILLAAHWDTRPSADYNKDGRTDQPIQGANDGASGVAVLLELARVFDEVPPAIGVDLLLTDGEDYGPGRSTMLMGAEHFAKELRITEARSYNYGILLDMIGDKDLDIRPERNSESRGGKIFNTAYEISTALGYQGFKQSGTIRIWDDHLPIMERGIRMYDFIDFNYEYWHTTGDTVDKCSPQSLECVGRTVENIVYLFPDLYDENDG